jgi:hypothetical protein
MFSFVVSFVSAVPVNNQNDISSSGNEFLATCSVVDKPSDQFNELDFLHSEACTGFIQGISEGVGSSFATMNKGESSILTHECAPW